MITIDFITKQLKKATYQLKEGTTTSYYWQEGTQLLPNRICFDESEMAKVKKSGRNNLHPIAGQLLSNFTQKEESPYKVEKPFKVRTQIWQMEDFPQFIGYGSLGITTSEGVKDTKDLVILSRVDERTIQICIFAGMATPEGMESAFIYLSSGYDKL